jgi:hypothetical protein
VDRSNQAFRSPNRDLDARFDAQLGQDVLDVRVDGSRAHAQLFGNLAVRSALHDQLGDLALAPRETRETIRLSLAQRESSSR